MKKLLYVVMPIVLAACGGGGVQEVQQWMDRVKQETRPSIPKLVEPKDFIPYTYDKKDELDPFNPAKLQSALAKMNPGSAHGIRPDLDRRKEALEAFPLDALKMVGTLTEGPNHYALLEADSKGVYQVKAGNYVGQNFGLVTKVNADSIEIKEIYLDSGGDWAERTQKLELQEAKK
jgi:type IV pilus assembly protein PilP